MLPHLALQIQRLGGYGEQVLVLTHVAQLQNEDAGASPSDVRETFRALHIPAPANISEYLKRLARNKLVLRLSNAQWALSPEGVDGVRRLMTGVTDDDLRHIGGEHKEALFGDAPHHLIPPAFAPAMFQRGIAKFLERHPFDTNVFCITRFPASPDDPVFRGIESCRQACQQAGLTLHLASEKSVEDLLFGNVAAAMWSCRYGIGIFEDRAGRGLRHNVSIEVGGMLTIGRRCLLLRDRLPGDKNGIEMPTDLVGHIYQSVDIGDEQQVIDVVRSWTMDIQ